MLQHHMQPLARSLLGNGAVQHELLHLLNRARKYLEALDAGEFVVVVLVTTDARDPLE